MQFYAEFSRTTDLGRLSFALVSWKMISAMLSWKYADSWKCVKQSKNEIIDRSMLIMFNCSDGQRWMFKVAGPECCCSTYQNKMFKLIIQNYNLVNCSLWNCYQMNSTQPHWYKINIGSLNSFVPSSNKPVPEPFLTQVNDTIWHSITQPKYVDK